MNELEAFKQDIMTTRDFHAINYYIKTYRVVANSKGLKLSCFEPYCDVEATSEEEE